MALQRRKSAAIGVKVPYPGFIEPALATSIDKVPKGDRWIHEIKFDGYRVQLHLANETVRVFTRRGNDWTKRFKKVADEAWHISARSAVIDGEIVVPAAGGTTDFSVLQHELKGKSTSIVMVAFDLLYLNGYDLRKLPLEERKSHLKKLIAKTAIQFSENFEADGPAMYKHACAVGLEGVVSKVRDSRYPSGRGNDWVKKTCQQRETLPIAGFALKAKKFDGIYLGRPKGKDLVYAGKVDHGFDKTSTAEMQARLKPLIRKTQPYAKKIAHRGVWVEPSLQAEIEYRAKSAETKCAIHFSKASGRICDDQQRRIRPMAGMGKQAHRQPSDDSSQDPRRGNDADPGRTERPRYLQRDGADAGNAVASGRERGSVWRAGGAGIAFASFKADCRACESDCVVSCCCCLGGLERDVSDPGMFTAVINGGIVKGHCVMLVQGTIVYAGPIEGAPTSGENSFCCIQKILRS